MEYDGNGVKMVQKGAWNVKIWVKIKLAKFGEVWRRIHEQMFIVPYGCAHSEDHDHDSLSRSRPGLHFGEF